MKKKTKKKNDIQEPLYPGRVLKESKILEPYFWTAQVVLEDEEYYTASNALERCVVYERKKVN